MPANFKYSLVLRAETENDLDFLRALYANTRSTELALVPWTPTQKQLFLNQQFDLQRLHYRNVYAAAEFCLLLIDDQPVGRWYLLEQTDSFLIVDISLLAEYRGLGIGSNLLHSLQAKATTTNKPVHLSVENHNPAQSLYRRLGFKVTANDGQYSRMLWTPGTPKIS